MMRIDYRFSVNGHVLKPLYSKDLKKVIEMESEQRFYRDKLDGKLTFIGEDFEWLHGQDFDTEFLLLIEKSINEELTEYEDYFKGSFYKTNGDWDEDNLRLEISIDVNDQYNKVLEGMRKEYNLITLAPALTAVTVTKRPMIQLYAKGQSSVACFANGNSWEQDAIEESDEAVLTGTYKFGFPERIAITTVTGNATPTDCAGVYTGEGLTSESREIVQQPDTPKYKTQAMNVDTYTFTAEAHAKTSSDYGSIYEDDNSDKWVMTEVVNANSLRFVQYFHSSAPPSGGDLTHVKNGLNTSDVSYTTATIFPPVKTMYRIVRLTDDVDLFYSKEPWPTETSDTDILMYPYYGVGTLTLFESEVAIFARYVLDKDTYYGDATFDIPDDDIVENNRNYKKVVPYNFNVVSVSNRATEDPTEYGVNEEGYYFLPKDDNTKYYPMFRALWGVASFWFNFTTFDLQDEIEGRKEYTLRDNYKIQDVLKVLLGEIDASVTHDGTPEYSEFLYGTTNPISGDVFQILFSQKSNILAGEYDRPAQKAPITLEIVLGMLKNVYDCYWFVEDGKLKIEHIKWFKNGRTYDTYAPQYTQDLTLYINPRNNKPWGYGSSKYKYEKTKLPEQLSFKWADDVTLGFEGNPIDIKSGYVQKGDIEEINISNITTDIDYMLLNPSAINPDGFALLASLRDVGYGYKVPIVEVHYEYDGYSQYMQNGWLSWLDLHPKYWRYNLPVRNVQINKEDYFALGVRRVKIQPVKYPSYNDPDQYKLVKTYIGDGEIEKININLSSRMNEITLKYDTE